QQHCDGTMNQPDAHRAIRFADIMEQRRRKHVAIETPKPFQPVVNRQQMRTIRNGQTMYEVELDRSQQRLQSPVDRFSLPWREIAEPLSDAIQGTSDYMTRLGVHGLHVHGDAARSRADSCCRQSDATAHYRR